MTSDLIARAGTGDSEAFGQLVEPYRQDLRRHCYRMVGSLEDADDALQDTLLAAWQGLRGFEGRSTVRTWLYRIATTRCLNAIRSRDRRGRIAQTLPGVDLPEATRRREVPWLEPCPEEVLQGLADTAPGPDARYEAKEAISLAFVTALQLLPPRQRAALILRDVLGFHTGEVASILESTEESVTSSLKRARATLQREAAAPGQAGLASESAAERELVEQFTRAFEAHDVDGIVALLSNDVLVAMPPIPFEWRGPALAGRLFRAIFFSRDTARRLVATRANGQPAFGLYRRDHPSDDYQARGLLVLRVVSKEIRAITAFDKHVLDRFGLPASLPASHG